MLSEEGAGNGGLSVTARPPRSPQFHLLEITIISAQDLHPEACRMRTYATAWVNSSYKLRTRIDTTGRTNPTWNDKFVFRVDAAFLRSDTSAVTIEIHANNRIAKDSVIGNVRLLMSAVCPEKSTRFVALQVRRPKSLRPQGIINVGVTLLDAFIRSIPMEPAFVLKDIVNTRNRSFPRMTIDAKADDEEWINECKLDRSYSVEVGRKVGEQERAELMSKLEKWKIDLSPVERRQHKGAKTSCFRGGNVID